MIYFSKMHIFEPVPDYNKQLEITWHKYNTQFKWNATVHKYGLGSSNRWAQHKVENSMK